MSKEIETLTPLEIFSKVDNIRLLFTKEERAIIKTALTEYEAIKNAEPTKALECLDQLAEMADKCWVSCDVYKWKNTIKQALIQKSKKEQAWDIVNKKQVDLGWLWYCIHECVNSLNEYNKKMPIDKFKLTEDEFNLLKEVLE